jgi:hypothetical protein
MASFAEDLRAVFRALAEARDGDFYRLYVGSRGENREEAGREWNYL